MIYLALGIFLCDLGSCSSSGQPGIAWWDGLWDDQHIVCYGQHREGTEVTATLETAVVRGPGNVSAAMW